MRLRALREHPDAFGMSYEESKDLPLEDSAARLQHKESFILGAFDGELIGMVGCFRYEALKARHRAIIWGVYVVPEAGGRGVARLLMEAAIERARKLPGVETLLLTAVTTNEQARRLYQLLGFVGWGIEPRVLHVGGVYLDKEHMALEL